MVRHIKEVEIYLPDKNVDKVMALAGRVMRKRLGRRNPDAPCLRQRLMGLGRNILDRAVDFDPLI